MNNVFYNPKNEIIHERFDLKGSWVYRKSKNIPSISKTSALQTLNKFALFLNMFFDWIFKKCCIFLKF